MFAFPVYYRCSLPFFKFFRFFLNSLFYALALTVITCYTSAIAGFVLAKYRFRGRGILFAGILMTMMVPGLLTWGDLPELHRLATDSP